MGYYSFHFLMQSYFFLILVQKPNLVSVYDEETNNDPLINKKDLRRFYHFNAASSIKTPPTPANYLVVRSQNGSKNDIIYIFARQDENKIGA